jgi:hypothetical protein
MVLLIWICAAAMLSLAAANLRLLLVAAAALDEAEGTPIPHRFSRR